MHYHCSGQSHVGVTRASNEDYLLAAPDLGLFVVCDGMGGHAAGEVASAMAAQHIERFVRERADVLASAANEAVPHGDLVALAEAAVQAAAGEVFEEARRNPACAGMGCTATLLLLAGTKGAMAHIGNTRLFLMRNGAPELLSTDHTMAADMVRRGQLTPDEVARSRYANAMTRCIGHEATVEIDTLALNVRPGDLFLLCSDGLSEYLEDLSDLASELAGSPLAEIPRALVDLANTRGGRDNVTALVVAAEASDDEQRALLNLSEQENLELEALRQVSAFSELGFADLVRLRSRCVLHETMGGETVVAIGDPCDRLGVVVEGRYSLQVADRRLRELGPGDSVGESTLLVQRPANATLRAESSGRLLLLSGTDFRDLARRRPWLGVTMLLRLTQRLCHELVETEPAPRPGGGDRDRAVGFLSGEPGYSAGAG